MVVVVVVVRSKKQQRQRIVSERLTYDVWKTNLSFNCHRLLLHCTILPPSIPATAT